MTQKKESSSIVEATKPSLKCYFDKLGASPDPKVSFKRIWETPKEIIQKGRGA